jgi:hypothetical protein
MSVAPGVHGTLDAGAGPGTVHCRIPVSTSRESGNLLVGQFGGDDRPLIKLRTFDGDIKIRPYEGADATSDI